MHNDSDDFIDHCIPDTGIQKGLRSTAPFLIYKKKGLTAFYPKYLLNGRKATILLLPHRDFFLSLQTLQILFGIMIFSFGMIFHFSFVNPYPRFPFIFISGYPVWGPIFVSIMIQVEFEANGDVMT